MQANRSAIQLIGMIMSKQTLDVNCALDLIQILNSSPTSCRDIITILEDIFKHQKSAKICVAVHALQYFVKNCNINFHYAANRDSFQKRLLALLNRIRGKTSIIKQLNSNTDNWCRIEAKVLYIIQLWYDAFILQESKYQHIINTYKILRKENVTFPPRSKNEKNLMLVETESPIFDNIEQIAHEDQIKFNKKLAAMGLKHLQSKMDKNIEVIERQPVIIEKKPRLKKQVNIDDISEKIGIIQSTENGTIETLRVIEELKKAIESGVVKPNEEAYWKEIKSAAYKLVEEWEVKNEELVKQEEKNYLERKLGMVGSRVSQLKTTSGKKEQIRDVKVESKQLDLLDGFDSMEVKEEKDSTKVPVDVKKQEVDLLDLL